MMSLNTQRGKMQNYFRKCTPQNKWRTEIKIKTKNWNLSRGINQIKDFTFNTRGWTSSDQSTLLTLPGRFEGNELSFFMSVPQLSQNTVLAGTQRNTELCCPRLGVVCVCVCVSNYPLWPCTHSSKHSGRLFHTNWHRRLHHTSIFMHAHTLQTLMLPFFFLLSPLLTCAQQKWHTDASTDGTHRPFLSLTAVFWYQTEPAEGEQTRWRGKISWSHSVAVHANTHRHKRTHKCMRRFCLDVKWLPALRQINRRQHDSTLQDFH